MLPFVFLILALLIDFGFGWLKRLEVQAAARFAGDQYVVQQARSLERDRASYVVRQGVHTHYFNLEDAVTLNLSDGETEVRLQGNARTELGSNGGGLVDGILDWIEDFSDRQYVHLSVESPLPVGTLLPHEPISAVYVIDGNTWPHQQVPISVQGITGEAPAVDDALNDSGKAPGGGFVKKAVQWVLKGFFWILGMRP